MTQDSRKLLEIVSPIPMENGWLRLLEPAESEIAQLYNRLLEGTYDKPFILDCGSLRFLHFDLDSVQSAMRRDDPDALCLAYTRKMMSFLLFNRNPRRILLLGLGGGSLAKFCYRHLPATAITVAEINPNVIALREEFQIPADNGRFQVLQTDGVGYVARRGHRKDVILVDACDRHGVAAALNGPEFYSAVRRRLTFGGILVMNVCGDLYSRAAHLARIRGVFGDHVITLPARDDGNLIVIASRGAMGAGNTRRLQSRALALQKHFGLNFPRYVRKMRHVAHCT